MHCLSLTTRLINIYFQLHLAGSISKAQNSHTGSTISYILAHPKSKNTDLLTHVDKSLTDYKMSYRSCFVVYPNLQITHSHLHTVFQNINSEQRKMVYIRIMRLDKLTIDLKHAYCPSACCKLHSFGIKNEVTLGAWHRPIDRKMKYRTVEPNLCDWLHTQTAMYPTPANLKHMEIIIDGLIPETKEVILAHELGFACGTCKEKHGKLDVTDCENLEQARRHIARAKK